MSLFDLSTFGKRLASDLGLTEEGRTNSEIRKWYKQHPPKEGVSYSPSTYTATPQVGVGKDEWEKWASENVATEPSKPIYGKTNTNDIKSAFNKKIVANTTEDATDASTDEALVPATVALFDNGNTPPLPAPIETTPSEVSTTPSTPPAEVKTDSVSANKTYRGTPTLPHSGLIDQAYTDRMNDYQAERANVEKQRATVDKFLQYDNDLLDRRAKGYKFFEDRFNAGQADNNRESNWLNPFGLLGGPARLFFGEERYNPKTGQMERTLPKSWDELSWNLLRNVGTMASGVQYTGGSGGKGGITFGYNPATPMALMNYQRQNAVGPYKDWEALQKKLAMDYTEPSFKPWAINNPYPRAVHPFENFMTANIGEELAFKTSLEQAQRVKEYLNVPDDSPLAREIDEKYIGFAGDMSQWISDLATNLEKTGASKEQIAEITKYAVLKRLGVENYDSKKQALDLKKYEIDQKIEQNLRENLIKARELELKGQRNEAELLKAEAMSNYYNAKAQAEGLKASGNTEGLTKFQAAMDKNRLFDQGSKLAADDYEPTVEEIDAWLKDLTNYGNAVSDVKGINYKQMGVDSETDPLTFEEKDGLYRIMMKLGEKRQAALQSATQTAPQAEAKKKVSSSPASTGAETPPLNEPFYVNEDEEDEGESELDQLSRQEIEAEANAPAKEEGEKELSPQDKMWEDFANRLVEANATIAKDKKEGKAKMKKLGKDLAEQVQSEDKRIGDSVRTSSKDVGDWGRLLVNAEKRATPMRYRIVATAFEPVEQKILQYKNEKGLSPTRDMVEGWIFETLSRLPKAYQDAIHHNTWWEHNTTGVPIWNDQLNKNIVFDYLAEKGLL